ncbi:MAG: patatin-like phospholipase family protein [Deltaproteobacteria bacterium]
MDEYGLALGGGGAKGSYEIGVWQALNELQIPISFVTGTSVGALNGAIIIQNDFNLAYKIWTETNLASVIRLGKGVRLCNTSKEKFVSFLNTFTTALANGGLDITPLKELLKANLKEEVIREAQMGYGIVTFSLSEMKPVKLYKENIPNGKLIDYIIASAGLPIFKRQTIDKCSFIDGGFCDVIPISLLLNKKMKNIIAVDISGPGIVNKVETSGVNIISIKNSRSTGGILDFNPTKAKENMEMGYCDTLKKFGKLKGKNYYMVPNTHFDFAKEKYLKTLTPDDFRKLYDFLGLNWSDKPEPMNKLIFYKIIRAISKYTDGKLSAASILPAMVEIAAEELEIENRKVYSFDILIDTIIEKYNTIVNSIDYKNFIKDIKQLLTKKRTKFFDWELKNKISQAKFLAYYEANFDENNEKLKNMRRFIAVTFPKISITNMCISLILSRKI